MCQPNTNTALPAPEVMQGEAPRAPDEFIAVRAFTFHVPILGALAFQLCW